MKAGASKIAGAWQKSLNEAILILNMKERIIFEAKKAFDKKAKASW